MTYRQFVDLVLWLKQREGASGDPRQVIGQFLVMLAQGNSHHLKAYANANDLAHIEGEIACLCELDFPKEVAFRQAVLSYFQNQFDRASRDTLYPVMVNALDSSHLDNLRYSHNMEYPPHFAPEEG
jgi:hypothetical protein